MDRRLAAHRRQALARRPRRIIDLDPFLAIFDRWRQAAGPSLGLGGPGRLRPHAAAVRES